MTLLMNVIAFRTLPEMYDDVYFYAPIMVPFPVPFWHFSQILCVFAFYCVCVLIVLCFALPSFPAHAFKRDLPG